MYEWHYPFANKRFPFPQPFRPNGTPPVMDHNATAERMRERFSQAAQPAQSPILTNLMRWRERLGEHRSAMLGGAGPLGGAHELEKRMQGLQERVQAERAGAPLVTQDAGRAGPPLVTQEAGRAGAPLVRRTPQNPQRSPMPTRSLSSRLGTLKLNRSKMQRKANPTSNFGSQLTKRLPNTPARTSFNDYRGRSMGSETGIDRPGRV